MRLPDRITTPRLVLRAPLLSDAQACYEEYAGDPEVTRYMIWPTHTSIQDALEFLPRAIEGWATGRDLSWALTLAGQDRIIGMFGVRLNDHRADFGYVLGRRYWNQGLMTEAGRVILDLVWQDHMVFRLWATCDTLNLASARVLEKLGLQREGILRRWIVHPNVSMQPRDSFVYSKVR